MKIFVTARLFATALLFACSLSLTAQKAPKPQTVAPTELEATKLRLLDSQMQNLQLQAQKITADEHAIVSKLEAEHPGYHWQGGISGSLVLDTPAPTKK